MFSIKLTIKNLDLQVFGGFGRDFEGEDVGFGGGGGKMGCILVGKFPGRRFSGVQGGGGMIFSSGDGGGRWWWQ